jgi:hypothetical protein
MKGEGPGSQRSVDVALAQHATKHRAHRLAPWQGPLIGKVMEEQVRWQIQNPEGTSDACVEHLKAFFASLV